MELEIEVVLNLCGRLLEEPRSGVIAIDGAEGEVDEEGDDNGELDEEATRSKVEVQSQTDVTTVTVGLLVT